MDDEGKVVQFPKPEWEKRYKHFLLEIEKINEASFEAFERWERLRARFFIEESIGNALRWYSVKEIRQMLDDILSHVEMNS